MTQERSTDRKKEKRHQVLYRKDKQYENPHKRYCYRTGRGPGNNIFYKTNDVNFVTTNNFYAMNNLDSATIGFLYKTNYL